MSEKKQIVAPYKFEPREWQRECLENLKRFTVIAVHRRAGKTTLAIEGLLLLKAINQPNALFAYIAPQLKQAKLIAWSALKHACMQFMDYEQGGTKYNLCEIRESDLTVKFWNHTEIRLFGADNPDSLRGAKLTGAVIDEVAQMPKELWFEIVYPALMDSKGFALFIGTPKGINLFSELYNKGLDPNFKEQWVSFKYTCYETNALDLVDIENYKKSVADEVFKREMLCDFSASANNQLISVFDVEMASKRSIDASMIRSMPVILGVDVARFGSDDSVIAVRQGVVMKDYIKTHGLDLVALGMQVASMVRDTRAKYVFVDGTGVGGGLVDILNNMPLNVTIYDINFGHKATDVNYNNKRSEMWGKMKDWLGRGGVILNDEQLKKELSMPTYEVNDKNQICLETKKAIRDRLGSSPDIADALALTFAEQVEIFNIEEEYDIDMLKRGYFFRKAKDPFARFEEQVTGNDYI